MLVTSREQHRTHYIWNEMRNVKTFLVFCCCSRRHVTDILADEMTGGKVLVFAHHRNVLDALEQSVVRTGRVEYIRIDGRTKVMTWAIYGFRVRSQSGGCIRCTVRVSKS